MIEFKGIYSACVKEDPTMVLVQYDGLALHVWHLAEPFHRLVSSHSFQIAGPATHGDQPSIKLPNGGQISTDDRRALERLLEIHPVMPHSGALAMPSRWLLALIGSMSLVIGLWWLAISGVLF